MHSHRISVKKLLFPFFLLLALLAARGQVRIQGTVVIEENQEVVDNAFVIITNRATGNFLEMVRTDEQGNFSFTKTFEKGVYLLEVTRVGFVKFQMPLVIADDQGETLRIQAKLKRSDFSQLGEVQVTAQRPIVVKKDTTIYDVKSFKEVYDETLEDVLNKIPGFKIRPNGDIEVNGKLVQKVLVDGKEISDFGAALLTKSISAEDVDKVEVRFDEKNKKIKESLLDESKFVVLDIQLKEGVNKKVFGKQNLQLGIKEGAKFGGLTSVFSLNKNVNLQFFAENNNFGNNFISLSQLKNIGDEAVSKIFSLPQDYNDIKSRSGFSDELYGFRNYTQNDNSLAGLAFNIVVSESTDIYIGSFSNYHFLRNASGSNLFFNDEPLNNFEENNFEQDYNSKNKIQIKHTTDKTKILADANFVLFENTVLMNNSGVDRNLFEKRHFSGNFYTNLSFEYLLNDKTGVSIKQSYTNENYAINTFLNSNNPSIINLIQSAQVDTLTFFQRQKNRENNFFTEVKLKNKNKWGAFYLGYKYLGYEFEAVKKADIPSFENLRTAPGYYQNSVFTEIETGIGNLTSNFSAYLTWANFPFNDRRKQDEFFEYELGLNYEITAGSSVGLKAQRYLSKFAFEKIIPGNLILDFQNVFIPTTSVSPFFSNIYSLTYIHNHLFGGIETSVALVRGKVNNLDVQETSGNIILRNADQLDTKFFILSTAFAKRFKHYSLTLEPEFFTNSFDIQQNGMSGTSKTERYLAGLKINARPASFLSVNLYPKYSHFVLSNSFSDKDNTFNFLTNSVELNSNFLNENFVLKLTYKNVYFFGTQDAFNNLDGALSYKKNNLKYFLTVGNLFNSRRFIIEDQEQNLFSRTFNQVFGQYFNFGVEFKF